MEKQNGPDEMFVPQSTFDTARRTAHLGAMVAAVSSVVIFVTTIVSTHIIQSKNYVAAIPVGDVWDYPFVRNISEPISLQESAKPVHVAMKYIRGMYEVDLLDYSEATVTEAGQRIMLSHRLSELLGYTIPDTPEFEKVALALERSGEMYHYFKNCRCVQRFKIDNIIVSRPAGSPIVVVEALGRMHMLGQDGKVPIGEVIQGYQLLRINMAFDLPSYDRSGTDIRPENPEGWYVLSSDATPISEKDANDLRKMRIDLTPNGSR